MTDDEILDMMREGYDPADMDTELVQSAELARLIAIEQAARDYRDAVSVYRQRCSGIGYTSGTDGDVRDTEACLFALLDSAPAH